MKKSFKINGMTCAACAQRIEKTFNNLDNVHEANVNFATEKMTLDYDESKVSDDDIKEKVKETGYEVIDNETSGTANLTIGGMTCAACAIRIEKALNNLDGVDKANVNLASEKASVSYDKSKINMSDIKKTIENTGYTVIDVKKNSAVDEDKIRKDKEIKTLKRKFIISLMFCIPLLYVAMGHMLGSMSLPLPSFVDHMDSPINFAILQILLTLPIVVVGRKFYTVGFKALMQKSPNMDSLIAIGTSAALIYSFYSTIKIMNGDHSAVNGLYFETVGVIITLILLGKTLETISKGRTSEAIKKLMGLAPKTAIIIRNGVEKEIAIDDVLIDDIIIVKPGDKIPVDGMVTEGKTSIDEAMLTGESMPVSKKEGDKVFAASINKNGTIKFKATKIGEDTALAQIIKLVEDAQGSKAPIAKMADIVSSYFVPIVCIIAVLAGLGWFLFTRDVEFSLTTFIAVLVIACPCALGLATPTAIMVSTGKGAELGILFKSGEALETAYKVNTIVFDKTGTLTEGKPKLTDLVTEDKSEKNRILALVASSEKSSEHPLGEAIVKEAEDRNLTFLEVKHFEAIPGHGIETKIEDETVLIGNKKLMTDRNIDLKDFEIKSDKLAEEGKTPMYISINNILKGIVAVADVVKPSSRNAVEKLQGLGIEVAMLTGDNKKTAEAIAKQLGIKTVLSEVLPQDKSNEVKKLQSDGKIVAMVGDGINDAPALAQANIGIAVGSGTDVAIESADVVLMKNDLMDVPTAIHLSRSTIRNIKENLFWAFAYNAAGIPLAAGILHIFGGPLLNPMFAAAAMSFSSISVLLNALRLKNLKAYK